MLCISRYNCNITRWFWCARNTNFPTHLWSRDPLSFHLSITQSLTILSSLSFSLSLTPSRSSFFLFIDLTLMVYDESPMFTPIRSNDNYDTTPATGGVHHAPSPLRKSVLRSTSALENLPVCHEDWWSSPHSPKIRSPNFFFTPPLLNRLRHSGNENATLGSTHGSRSQRQKKERTSQDGRKDERWEGERKGGALGTYRIFSSLPVAVAGRDNIVSRVSHVNWLKGFASRCA